MAVQGISWSGVFVRVVLAVALVLLTYNPSGHSFYHWAVAPPPGITALKAFLGIVLIIGWVICLRTAFVALGWLGAGHAEHRQNDEVGPRYSAVRDVHRSAFARLLEHTRENSVGSLLASGAPELANLWKTPIGSSLGH